MAWCESCGARIVWCPTIWRNRMPLDATPNPDGNMVVNDEGFVEGAEGWPPDRVRWTAHHETCPFADEWRGRKRAMRGQEALW